MLVPALLLIGILSIGAMGFELKKRKQVPVMDAGLFMRFALLPGERHGPVWPAAHASGESMVATITSTGVFALNYSQAQALPVRLDPAGAVVVIGTTHMIAPGASEPLVDVTVTSPRQPPVSFSMAIGGADALVAWAAAPRSTPGA